jgi:CRISPR/Cas system-associated protein endoribonuclease Cas2
MQALIDRTEYISSAMIAYRTAITHQVDGGFGYLFLETAFVNDRSFDQDIYIKAAPDPRAVYLDPDVKEPDGSDAQFGFIFDKVPRDRFNREHPKFKDKVGTSTLGEDALWITDKHILVVMYYERTAKNDELITYNMPDGSTFTGHRSQMEIDSGKELVDQVIEQIESGVLDGQYRDVITQDVNWYLIGGDCILKRGDTPKTRWIGQYIPIIPCYGIKTVIEGKMDCKGHTRAQISAQQMLNYNASGQVQFGALQSRTPYIGSIRAFETNEKEWATANIEDYAYLAYDDWVQEEGEDGRSVAAPTRQEPPQSAPVYMQGMQDAEKWAMMVTGQYQSQMGQEDIQAAASGKAINARQRQGNIATYHFTEHQYDMYRYLGKQLIGIYPKLYDTKRILHVEGEDLSKKVITIDPEAIEAIQRIKKETETAEEIIFNPMVGEYEVLSDPGPNYATQRQQAWDAMTQIIAQNKELTAIMGDLAISKGDFAGAQEIAERVKKWIKHSSPWLFDDGQDPNLASLQVQIAEGQKLNSELMIKLADEKLKVRGYSEKRDIDAYGKETDRMKVWIEAAVEQVLTRQQADHELHKQANQHVFDIVERANERAIEMENSQPEDIPS